MTHENLIENEDFGCSYSGWLDTVLWSKQGYGKGYQVSRKIHEQAMTYRLMMHGTERFYVKGRDARFGLSMLPSKPKPVALNFGLWDQAEMRHRNDVAKVLTSREKRAMIADVTFGARFGRGADPLKGRRFIGSSEPTDADAIDSSYLMRLTGDEFVETRTFHSLKDSWEPQGELYVASGQKLKFDKDKKG